MQDYHPEAGFVEESGMVRFRGEGWQMWAADGQAGTVLKAFREHLVSPDDQFLRRLWPRVRKSLEFLINEDGDGDGLIEGSQHNTYDIDFYGPNTMVGSLYLAALRAGEQMAQTVGDREFAATCRKIFESGSRLTVEKLFDGEYFVQKVDLAKHPGISTPTAAWPISCSVKAGRIKSAWGMSIRKTKSARRWKRSGSTAGLRTSARRTKCIRRNVGSRGPAKPACSRARGPSPSTWGPRVSCIATKCGRGSSTRSPATWSGTGC
jgi:hypothetical protein